MSFPTKMIDRTFCYRKILWCKILIKFDSNGYRKRVNTILKHKNIKSLNSYLFDIIDFVCSYFKSDYFFEKF